MASSSSSSLPRTWKYNVFVSFHGPDVREKFLSHLSRQFKENGITMFYDQEIERGQIITPALIEAIRGSRIAILILSKNYASSGWCLDELLEIMECKKAIGQIVMTIFYGVEPSDVRHQRGEFGIGFNETFVGKTEEKKRIWSQALNDAAIIAGEDFKNCANEAERIAKIAKDISNKLHATPSRDSEGMVGLEAHLREMDFWFENLDATPSMIVGICGPAGIGKSTIARALHSRHSSKFQQSCFVDNLRESYPGVLDEYTLKLSLQAELLSRVLNLKDIAICHLGVLQERLGNLRVLIILDDVRNITQLEALANESTWFGRGSRIVITTENKELLQQHGINNTYHVMFPSDDQALKILCGYDFRQSYPRNGFEKLAGRVTELCGKLPLGLRVVGSALRGRNEEQWEGTIRRLDTVFDDKDIHEVLRVGYESLHANEKTIFVHVAIFFNYDDSVIVEHLLAENMNNLDIKHGLEILANKSLIYFSIDGQIMMHKLLQQVGKNIVRKEKPWKQKILVDAQNICDILEDGDDGEYKQVLFDISGIKEVIINKKAFKRMNKLRFLKVINGIDTTLHIPEGMELPHRLRFFHWHAYPGKAFLPRLSLQYIVELNMRNSKLEKLWEGAVPLTNLKKMDLRWSMYLKELPDLSNATKLESLNLNYCIELMEIPSSTVKLQKLEGCVDLQVPTHLSSSLESVFTFGCYQLRNFPDYFRNITELSITVKMLQNFSESIRLSSCLRSLLIFGDGKEILSEILGNEETEIKDALEKRALEIKDIEKLPDCIKDLHGLERLLIDGCPKLASLPELPASLKSLDVLNCESLETLMPFSSESAIEGLYFTNCLKLGEDARRVITQQSAYHCLVTGRNVPAEFKHRAIGNSLTIPSGKDGELRICIVLSPKQGMKGYGDLLLRQSLYGFPFEEITFFKIPHKIETEHLCIFSFPLPESKLLMEFSTTTMDIIECRFEIIMNETSRALEQHQDILKNVTELSITDAMLQNLLECVSLWSHLLELYIHGSSSGRLFPEERWLTRGPDIEKISDCFKDLHGLQELGIKGCPKLASLPELPASLTSLFVFDCDSLETLIPFSPESKIKCLYFSNCLKLGEEARRVITQQSTNPCLVPGRNVPAEFEHGATGNSLTLPIGTDSGYRVCVVLSPKQKMEESADLLCRQSCNGFTIEEETLIQDIPKLETEHLCIIRFTLPYKSKREIVMEFSTTSKNLDIIECGFQIIMNETSSSYGSISDQISENDDESVSDGSDQFDEPRVKRLTRLQLISTVIITSFVCSCLLAVGALFLPKSVTQFINKLSSNFVWRGNFIRRRRAWFTGMVLVGILVAVSSTAYSMSL